MESQKLLTGQVICFTGTLRAMKREKAREIVADLGGQTTDGITARTTTLVCGTKPGAKLSTAQLRGIPIWGEEQFLDKVRQHSAVVIQRKLLSGKDSA